MKSNPEPSTREVLAGLVERVTFQNAENGFCVLRAKARGHRDLVTVVGHAAIISAGEWITASGEWINDRGHGQQFKARFLKTSAPSSIDGIEKYLGSGMIRGIGPVYAKKMVKAFGEKVFDVIEAEPDRLREVTGIGAGCRCRRGCRGRRECREPVRGERVTDLLFRSRRSRNTGRPACARSGRRAVDPRVRHWRGYGIPPRRTSAAAGKESITISAIAAPSQCHPDLHMRAQRDRFRHKLGLFPRRVARSPFRTSL